MEALEVADSSRSSIRNEFKYFDFRCGCVPLKKSGSFKLLINFIIVTETYILKKNEYHHNDCQRSEECLHRFFQREGPCLHPFILNHSSG
ncbi:hypothetical protein JTB14_034417 [Gonioctena quinquepunctata]|nr:hypothetical protein JTB14_034417 [Gonioctena quinquepunctata]